MRIGVINYHCIKCTEPVIIQHNPDVRTGDENPMVGRLLDSKLCLHCYTENRIESLVECLLH